MWTILSVMGAIEQGESLVTRLPKLSPKWTRGMWPLITCNLSQGQRSHISFCLKGDSCLLSFPVWEYRGDTWNLELTKLQWVIALIPSAYHWYNQSKIIAIYFLYVVFFVNRHALHILYTAKNGYFNRYLSCSWMTSCHSYTEFIFLLYSWDWRHVGKVYRVSLIIHE